MLINELSRKSGITPHTIRFYERSGLIRGQRKPDVTSNNYYHYDEETLEKLEFIHDAKSVGFTIREIGQFIDAWYGDGFTRKQKLALLDEKLKALDDRLREIRDMKKRITRFKDDILNGRC